jgi:hypothetical protein
MTAFLIIVAALAVVILVLIVVAPWKAVRDEPKIDKADEAKLLLHRNPDEPTGEYRAVSALSDGPDEETDPNATYEDLAKLDEEADS